MRADIFCRVIDNFGDIGVCWRLARRMTEGHQWKTRLWVDNLDAFARIQPGVIADAAQQLLHHVEIIHWTEQPIELEPGDVVIEAFACDPPENFVQAMRQRLNHADASAPLWINLEYLSAESWVEGCHLLPSLRPDGLTKYFFFPGFTTGTGGLLREPSLTFERDAMQQSPMMQRRFLERLGVQADALAQWQDGARLISLFCYPYAPISALAQALLQSERPAVLLVPQGVAPTLETELANREQSARIAQARVQSVKVARIPFISQPDFDRVLWCADLNFVRGEDSFIRASWAARPLVWQIYAQEENAHLEKLESWLAHYPIPSEAQNAIRQWNDEATTPSLHAEHPFVSALSIALQETPWTAWQAGAKTWDTSQAAGPDLGDRLAEFCTGLSKKPKKR
jgi:uncharacterized repeat protein (TIGR03837 family)